MIPSSIKLAVNSNINWLYPSQLLENEVIHPNGLKDAAFSKLGYNVDFSRSLYPLSMNAILSLSVPLITFYLESVYALKNIFVV